jgi:hypothetical protein
MITSSKVEEFFNQYASAMNSALFDEKYDIAAITNSFANYIVGANPMGVRGGVCDDEFAKAIKAGIEFYKNIGIISMNILGKQITVLDDLHAVATIHWTSIYDNGKVSGEIPFDVVYLVELSTGTIRIFAYITGDEMHAFRVHNLIG